MVESLNKVGIRSSFALGSYNLIKFLSGDFQLYMIFTNVVFFFVVGLLLIKNKSIKTHIIIFLAVGYLSLGLGYQGNFSGIIFICFALGLIKKMSIKIYVCIMAGAVIMTKGILMHYDAGVFMVLLMGAAIVADIYFTINGKAKAVVRIVKDIKEDQILNMFLDGKNAKTIAQDLDITANGVNRHVSRIRKKYGYENNYQLFSGYNKGVLSGHAKKESDKCD